MATTLAALAAGSQKPPIAKGALRIYGMRFCPYVHRVRLVLAAKKIPYEIVNIHLKSKPDWFLAMTPEGKVPLLEQDDKLLWESLIISDYLDEVYPHPKLWPEDPYERARVKMALEATSKLRSLLLKLFTDKTATAFENILNELPTFEKYFQDTKKPFFSDNSMSSLKVYTAGSSEPAPPAKGTLRLYGNRFCPYVYRVRLVLAAKKIPHEVINIHLTKKPEWYFVKNPAGKVPTIEFDNNILYESLIIADYLDTVYPQSKLWSDDPLKVAKGKILIERVGKIAALNAKIYREKDYSAYKDILEEFNFFHKILQKIQKPFFSGDKVGMVDYMIWPFFETVFSITDLGTTENIPEFLSIKERPALTLWIEKMQNDPVVQMSTTGKEIIQKFLQGVSSGNVDYDLGLTD